jgi:hypothetical protein
VGQVGRLELLALVDRVRHLAGERSRIDLTCRRLNRAGPAKIHKLSLVPWELDPAHSAKIIAERIFTVGRPGAVPENRRVVVEVYAEALEILKGAKIQAIMQCAYRCDAIHPGRGGP